MNKCYEMKKCDEITIYNLSLAEYNMIPNFWS